VEYPYVGSNTNRKHESIGNPFMYGQRQAKYFLKTFAKRAGELLSLNRNQLRIMRNC